MKRHAVQVVLALAFAASTVSGGVNVWTTNGPSGEKIRALAIDPTNTATLYAGTAANGIFKSTDGGGSWARTGLIGTDVQALAIDPLNPATLYAGTFSGVFKSTDSGANWAAVNTGLGRQDVTALAIDPLNPATLYAGTFGIGVYKSTDSGGTWASASTGLGSPYVEVLAVDAATPATLYAGTVGPQVFKSTDAGGTWSETGAGPNDPWGYGGCGALAMDPAAPATVYAGTDYGLFKSTDGGSSWTIVNNGLTTTVMALAIDPSEPATLYAGTWDTGVFKSVNGGASWTSMNAGLTNLFVKALAIDPWNPARLYAGTDAGVYGFLTVAGSLGFYTVPPCRVADTRNAPGPSGGPALAANTTRSFPVSTLCGIPASATAVALNLTVVFPTGDGDLRVFPAGSPAPNASAINFRPGIVRANSAIIPIGAGGMITIQCEMTGGATDFFFDVYGYFK